MTTTVPSTTPAVLEDLDKEARAIESLGLRYQTIEVLLDDIDIDASEHFNQRFEGRSNDDVILQYALSMERGAEFPKGTVFFDTKARKYKLISGVHRTQSRRLAHTENPHLGLGKVKMFEVIISPPGDPDTMKKIEDLGFLLNSKHGFGLSETERYAAAIRTLSEREMTIEEAAIQHGLNAEKLQEEHDNYLADKQLLQYGLDPSSFTRLKDKRAVLTLPDTFWMHEAEKLLRNYRDKHNKPVLSQDAFYSFVRFIITNKGDAERQARLLEVQETLVQGKKPRQTTGTVMHGKPFPAHTNWRRSVSTFERVSPVELVNAAAKTEDSADILRDEIARVRAFLDDVEKAVEAKWHN